MNKLLFLNDQFPAILILLSRSNIRCRLASLVGIWFEKQMCVNVLKQWLQLTTLSIESRTK